MFAWIMCRIEWKKAWIWTTGAFILDRFEKNIAKSLVFKEKTTDQPILVIASGLNRVDLKKIREATGLRLGKADGTFVKERVGYAIGGVPPVGHNEPLKTILDPDLKKYDVIWAAAGTPFAVFQMKPSGLERLTCGIWVELSE